MVIKVESFWQCIWFQIKRALSNESGALTFSVKNIITHGFGGLKLRLVTITLDAVYATPGYTITPAQCKLKTQILFMSSAVIGIYLASPSISGVNAILQMIVGAAGVNAEAADNLAGLDAKVGKFWVVGY